MDDIQALLAMARDRSCAGREYLASAVGDFFAEGNGVLNDRERAIMTDILTRLVKDVEVSVRRKLAERLASAEAAPRALLIELANDDIEIAAPVLSRSKVLRDIDLIEIVRHRAMEHQLKVAMRERIGPHLAEALVETDNAAVVETLLRNRGATIAPETLRVLVERSQEQHRYQEPLLRREELSVDLAKRMYWWVSAALREAILDRYELDVDDFDDAMEAATRDSLANSGVPGVDRSPETLKSLLAIDEVAQNAMVKALRAGEVTLFQMLFHKATGLRLPFLRELMFEPGGERLAIACRAIDMAPKVFSALYRLIVMTSKPDAPVPRGDLTRIVSIYLDIRPDLAMTVLRQWRRDPDYLVAIEQVTKAPPLM